MRLPLQGLAIAVAFALAGPAASAGKPLAGTPVPSGFAGVNLDGPPLIPQDNVSLSQQFSLMASSGVQSIRTTFNWAVAQPYESWTDVPADEQYLFVNGAGGVPTNFLATDPVVALAAEHGMTLVPTVMYTTAWDEGKQVGNSLIAPRSDGPYAQFVTTLVDRYGPNGSFWQDNPSIPYRPIREWEIWNEPWITYYWPVQPFQSSYINLLRVAHAAIKRADPSGKVVLGGMPNASWDVLKSVYRVRGARGLFDVVDIHAYTKYPPGVIKILALDRAVMKQAGDGRKPIILGEWGWTSSLHQVRHEFDWETTPAGQARNLRGLVYSLAANRKRLGLAGFYWYTWMGDSYRAAGPWGYSGLLGYHDGRVWQKPALSAFGGVARAIEHRR